METLKDKLSKSAYPIKNKIKYTKHNKKVKPPLPIGRNLKIIKVSKKKKTNRQNTPKNTKLIKPLKLPLVICDYLLIIFLGFL